MQSLRRLVIPNNFFRTRCRKACPTPQYEKPMIILPSYNQQYQYRIKCKYCQCCENCCCFPNCTENIQIYVNEEKKCVKVAEQ